MSTSLGLTPFTLNDGAEYPALGLVTYGMSGEDKPARRLRRRSDVRRAPQQPLSASGREIQTLRS